MTENKAVDRTKPLICLKCWKDSIFNLLITKCWKDSIFNLLITNWY